MQFITSPAARAAKLPFSQAVRVGNILYLSGALGNLPGKMELVPGGMEAETKQTMENIAAVLRDNELTFDHVFKCTAMLADISKWGDFNKVYVTTSSLIACPHVPRSAPTASRSVRKSNSSAWRTWERSNRPSARTAPASARVCDRRRSRRRPVLRARNSPPAAP